MSKLILCYIDTLTGRLARATAYTPSTCPADIEEFQWVVASESSLPAKLFDNTHSIERNYLGQFSRTDTEISASDLTRIQGLNAKADCLEQLSRSVSYMRFLKNRNMFGNSDLRDEYFKEIAEFDTTSVAGPLLRSLVDDDADILQAIMEFKIKDQSYTDFLILTETILNKWSRQIKNSDVPYDVLDKLRATIGPFIR